LNPGVGVKEVAGIHKKDPFSFFPQLIQKSGAPGQTAKQKVPSAAGLNFSVHVCRKGDGKLFNWPAPRSLRPAGSGEQKDEQKKSEYLAQMNLLKKIG